MEYRTFIIIVMLCIYFSNQFLWFSIADNGFNDGFFNVWMREVVIIVVVFAMLALICIHTIQKTEGIDCKCH